MDNGGCVYVVLRDIHIAVFPVSALNSRPSSFGYVVIIHNDNICFVHVGLRDNWSGVDIGQLAFQHIDIGRINGVCLYMGNNVSSKKMWHNPNLKNYTGILLIKGL